MLRLYLDANEGASMICCPECGRPLLLGARRMGHWLVGYRGGFRIRPGKRAQLVCPAYDCDYEEEVEIARRPSDAVIYSAFYAATKFHSEHRVHEQTLAEVRIELERVMELYTQTRNPKIRSAVRFWQDRYEMMYQMIFHYLEESLVEEREVICQGKQDEVRGKVLALLPDGALFERSDTGQTILLRGGDVRMVLFCWQFGSKKMAFDFADGSDILPGNHPMHVPTRFAVISGHALALDSVSRFGLCRVSTEDAAVARELGLWKPREKSFSGEFPSALVDRCFRRQRYAYVGGHKLYLISAMKLPDMFQLGSHNMETARELKMHRQMKFVGQRKALRWWRYFRQDEIERWEELELRMRLPRYIRRPG